MKRSIHGAESLGTYSIFLKGSRRYIRRTVWIKDSKTYIIFYDQITEVKKCGCDYITIEPY